MELLVASNLKSILGILNVSDYNIFLNGTNFKLERKTIDITCNKIFLINDIYLFKDENDIVLQIIHSKNINILKLRYKN